jgi:hypothetical protein
MRACAQGLHLPAERILIAPRLLADLATYAAGKPSCIKAVVKLLPELCQVLGSDLAHPSLGMNNQRCHMQLHVTPGTIPCSMPVNTWQVVIGALLAPSVSSGTVLLEDGRV